MPNAGTNHQQRQNQTQTTQNIVFAGSVQYNAIDDVIQYCNGKEWISLLTEHATRSLGGSKAQPASSCLDLSKLAGYKPGVYWIQPSANYPAYRVQRSRLTEPIFTTFGIGLLQGRRVDPYNESQRC